MRDFKLSASYTLNREDLNRKPSMLDYIKHNLYFTLSKLDVWSKPRNPSWYIKFLYKIGITPSSLVIEYELINKLTNELSDEIDKEIIELMMDKANEQKI